MIHYQSLIAPPPSLHFSFGSFQCEHTTCTIYTTKRHRIVHKHVIWDAPVVLTTFVALEHFCYIAVYGGSESSRISSKIS